MDYTPINYRYESGEVQGDYAMIDIGPYDFWAIEYGYTFDEKNLPEILKRCSEPELAVRDRRRYNWTRSVGPSIRFFKRSARLCQRADEARASFIAIASWKSLSKTAIAGPRLVVVTS